jgi:hypothetical protein
MCWCAGAPDVQHRAPKYQLIDSLAGWALALSLGLLCSNPYVSYLRVVPNLHIRLGPESRLFKWCFTTRHGRGSSSSGTCFSDYLQSCAKKYAQIIGRFLPLWKRLISFWCVTYNSDSFCFSCWNDTDVNRWEDFCNSKSTRGLT